MFKPVVHECEVTDGEETYKFFVREPSGREILMAAEKAKRNKERPSIENARELFAKYIVTDDGGQTPISPDDVNAILDMRLEQMQQVSELVQDRIGLKKALEKNA